MRQIGCPTADGSKVGHGFWYTVGAFEVTHNDMTNEFIASDKRV